MYSIRFHDKLAVLHLATFSGHAERNSYLFVCLCVVHSVVVSARWVYLDSWYSEPAYTGHLGGSIVWPLLAGGCFEQVDLCWNSAIGTKKSDHSKGVAALINFLGPIKTA